MQQKLADPRVHKMFSGDRYWAFAAVLTLWATYAFVFWRVLADTADQDVVRALAISGGLVLVFNTASIIAMIAHYSHDKDHIYGLDIHYLDEMKKARG